MHTRPGPARLPERGHRLTSTPKHHVNHQDWTEDLPKTDHVRFFCETDWGNSKLGPLKDWSPSLRLFTRMVLADSRAACLWWSPNLVAIYNEAYKPLSGKAHPKLMGATFRAIYPDLWERIKPYFDRARESGVGTDYLPPSPLMVERDGQRQETFFKGSFVPVGSGPLKHPDGFYNSLFEITIQRLVERRTAMLNRMASVPSLTSVTAWPHVIATLETNAADVPLAMIYEAFQGSGTTTLRLRGHTGLPEGHCLFVEEADISSSEGVIPDCRRAGSDILIIDYDGRFASIRWRGFGAPSKQIAILPLTNGDRVFGYLIVGTNPYRPYDDMFHQFHHDLRRMVSSIITTAVNTKEIKQRQHQLESDLAFSDLKLRHLIEHASVGMVHMTIDKELIWANEQYYVLHGLPPDRRVGKLDFLEVYADEDRPKADEAWEKLRQGASHITVELRLKRFYTSPFGEHEPAHIQVLAFPYTEEGHVKSIMAAITDISRLKWAHSFQARLAAEAREAKRQQEAFIDVVSHEMRNPLSAIVHCADEISKSGEECQAQLADIPAPYITTLNSNVSAANIILQCANHQKHIIDDVLTLSKLDSMLLSITPTAVHPQNLINSIVNIFKAELKADHIHYTIIPDVSLSTLQIEELYFDPSRVTQIFINLLTNAIKFVKPSSDPSISIRYGATTSEPRRCFPKNMFWPPEGEHKSDPTSNPEWGTGEPIYLTFTVRDTGIGINESELHNIWERFKQANVRTHVKYGGSGLGLFISKELAEKQGGEIGASSAPDHGSIFGFYIRARRIEKHPQAPKQISLHVDTSNTQQLCVLLVEDNIINQQVLKRQLSKAGCLVEVANHGGEALEWLEKNSFDVVLMDLEMPVMDGLTAIKEIRKRQREGHLDVGHLPIIAVTANVRQEQMDTAIAAGADSVMQKPFKAVDLVYMMKGLVPHQVATPSSERPTPGLSGPLNGILF